MTRRLLARRLLARRLLARRLLTRRLHTAPTRLRAAPRWRPTLILLAALSACSIDEIVSTTEPVTGPGTVYALASANDVALPATFSQDGTAHEVRSGALTLGPDSSFIFSIALRSSFNGGQPTNGTTTIRGSYSRSGTELTMTRLPDTLFVGTYAPASISLQRARAQVVGDRFTFVR